MKRVLGNKVVELLRGDEGVALVVTLAVFMFMYIFCAGVFAVGEMVKDRICLQNAADAAAYSAAVVQADTLSRIATINRAMSWTYAQMNKRRMDFIVYKWMDSARKHYSRDRFIAANWVGQSLRHRPHNVKSQDKNFHGKFDFSLIKPTYGFDNRGSCKTPPDTMRSANSRAKRDSRRPCARPTIRRLSS